MDFRYAVAAVVVATFAPGCASLGGGWLANTREQCRRAVEEMKADISVLDSNDDGLDAFGPADAQHLRAARADMPK